MYDFTMTMAIVDFVPVLLFAVAAVILMRDLYEGMTKYGFAMLAAGCIDVFAAGFLKAVWKLLYAAGICDFHTLNTLFLPTQSLGFLMAGLAVIILVCNKKRSVLAVAAPQVFSGTVLFLVMMVAGLGFMCAGLGILAVRMKKKSAAILFAVSFAAAMGMGYAGRLDSTAAWVNWMEQGINIVSQGALLAGVLILHKAEIRKDGP